MVAQLAIVKENLRQAIQQRTAAPMRRKSGAMAEAAAQIRSARRDEAPEAPRRSSRRSPADKPSRDGPLRPRSCAGCGAATGMRWALFALLPLALIVGGYWYVTGGQIMSTDDAYVEADKVGISTDVSGIVQDVDVTENQHVAAGQVLYRLDPRQFQIALDNAKANLAQTALTIEAMKQDYKRMLSDAAAQQAQVDLDQTNYDRERHAAAKPTPFRRPPTTRRKLHARQRQEQARSRCASRRRCSSPSSAAIPTSP